MIRQAAWQSIKRQGKVRIIEKRKKIGDHTRNTVEAVNKIS